MPVKRKRALRLFSKFPIDRRRLFAKRFRSPRRREATYRCPLGRKSRHYPKVSIYSEREPRKNALESNLPRRLLPLAYEKPASEETGSEEPRRKRAAYRACSYMTAERPRKS